MNMVASAQLLGGGGLRWQRIYWWAERKRLGLGLAATVTPLLQCGGRASRVLRLSQTSEGLVCPASTSGRLILLLRNASRLVLLASRGRQGGSLAPPPPSPPPPLPLPP